jgi:hypothetical protein
MAINRKCRLTSRPTEAQALRELVQEKERKLADVRELTRQARLALGDHDLVLVLRILHNIHDAAVKDSGDLCITWTGQTNRQTGGRQ